MIIHEWNSEIITNPSIESATYFFCKGKANGSEIHIVRSTFGYVIACSTEACGDDYKFMDELWVVTLLLIIPLYINRGNGKTMLMWKLTNGVQNIMVICGVPGSCF